MPHDTRPLSLPGFLILIATAVGPMLALALALDAAARRTGGLELGEDIPMLQHVDRAGTLDIAGVAALPATTLAHTTALRGYAQLWLPEGLDLWGSDMLSAGTFVLVATLAWQTRELLTRGTAWRRTDRVLAALGLLALAGVASVPLGRYNAWAWTASIIAWLVNILGTGVAAANLRRHGASAERVLACVPYAVHNVAGTHLAAYFLGLAHARYEAGVLWQIEAFFFYTLITVAAATGLMQKYRASALAQKQLLAELAHSEQVLEERVLQRTSELLQAQNALHAALHSEREMRQEQRHFFDMVNHEFRTPLAVVNSAATEQQAFPGPETAPQVERAAQIRRACRRLMALVDNCLVSDRLDAQAFKPQWRDVPLADIVDAAAELVQWSRRHHLRLDTARAPAWWTCDPALVRIALSNLVDNAVKHARPGEITLSAHSPAPGLLALAVSDQGPGLPPEAAQHLFARCERGASRGCTAATCRPRRRRRAAPASRSPWRAAGPRHPPDAPHSIADSA